MKRYISVFVIGVLLLASLAGCGNKTAENSGENDGLQIVATIFPEYDWVMNILGDNPANAQVTMLMGNGVDLHSYQPSAADILKISTCDVFIYVGGESDEWVEDVLKEAVNKDMTVINLMDELGDQAKEEELVEGMQEEEPEHDHEEGEAEFDEHVWLSLRNASTLVQSISDAIREADPDHGDVYKNNTDSYIEKLGELDEKYDQTVKNARYNTLLFGDRFPFRYLVDDYGLEYYAAFAGCSAETEASFETITFLAQKVDELKLPVVMTIDGSDGSIAETIIQNTQSKDQKILTLNSLQSVTSEDLENKTTYLSVMEENLSVLTEALK